jgi:hypothetical protein
VFADKDLQQPVGIIFRESGSLAAFFACAQKHIGPDDPILFLIS